MSINWPEVWQTLGSTALIIAAAAWIAKSFLTRLLDHWAAAQQRGFAKDLEAHKQALEVASAAELARLRASLETAATEHRVRFTRLHETQAEVVAEVFAGLERVHLSFRAFVSPLKSAGSRMADHADEAWKKFQEFQSYYYERAIWLDAATCSAINDILGVLFDVFIDMTHDVDEHGYPTDRAVMKACVEKITEQIPKARGELDRYFRSLLGVERDPIVLPAVPPQAEEAPPTAS